MSGILQATIEAIRPPDAATRRAAATRQDRLTKPPGALGRLETMALDLAAMTADPGPVPEPAALVLAAADHGVAEEGVSAYPKAVTAQMVYNFLEGGAAVNAIAGCAGVSIFPVDAGVDHDFGEVAGLYRRKLVRGSGNFSRGAALTTGQATGILESGIEFAQGRVREGFRCLAVGDMGIGNTTAAAAVTAVVTGAPAQRVTGRGTMVDQARYRRKLAVVEQAVARHGPVQADGMAVLAAFGGCETGFLAGCILGAASVRVPVLLDGFPTTAAALIADRLCPQVRHYCVAGHRSAEPGHDIALRHLGLTPLLDLSMRLGEGTGAVLAYGLVRAACRCLTDMATFSQADVAGPLG